MKKFFALALSAVMMLSLLAGCGSKKEAPQTQDPGKTEQPAASELNVAVFYYDYSDVYISSVRNAMDGMFADKGIKPNNYDGAGNQAQQTDQINTAISNGANLLIVNIVETSSPDAAQNAVEVAKTAGIPIVFFNREVSDDVVNSYEQCAFVGTNAPEAGHMQGQLVGQYLVDNYETADLNGDGTISYVMFKGQEGNAEAEARTQFGVEDANTILTGAGKPELAYYNASAADKYLVDQGGKWSAQAANDYMATILPEYSEANGNMVELIICNNDGMAEGAVSALQGAGYNLGNDKDGKPTSTVIPVFGVDATDSAKQLINEGKMTGTIKQDAEGMASTILTLVGNIKDGAALMDNTASFNVDKGVAKIRVPYGTYTGE
ncbi:galactose ABC transporter substrate-binding protein [Oscillibacter sp.]|uniref:galactose ABC transporter substrate-binding protein n=1 Tax=Oscillibacter sp. TaxID=1945593 RepID=UPI00262124B0|nr:galactose ABC transporter substrate-binding protein [Oscillibacter sp.]MDD3346096.1 galactose ABC transporter substrate-binding protein [Oscillibacter sp.]